MSIVIKDVSRSFSLPTGAMVTALQNVNLLIEDQEFVCLLGPSGCGKTTLLNILAGLDKPTDGIVEINGRRITGPGTDRAVVFQDYALFPWRTVIENVEFGLQLRGISQKERRQRAKHYLKLVNLDNFANAYIHQLSGGMKQRVALARALILEPKVILMDEPFGALDTFTRMQLQQELISICKESSPTVVFVTHDIDEAIFLGDRVVVMTPNPGKVSTVVDIPLFRPRDRAGFDFTKLKTHVFKEFSLANALNLGYAV